MRDLSYLNRARVALRGELGDAYNGAFVLRVKPSTTKVLCLASNGGAWDHVSVSVRNERRLPTWYEMCFVKSRFFDEEETVMQLHPPRSQHISNCEVLHMWRPQEVALPMPPAYMVGFPGVTPEQMPALVRALQVDARIRRILAGEA